MLMTLRSGACLLALVFAGCGTSPLPPSPEEMAATVQQDVESLLTSLYDGDFAAVISYTHPVIVKSLGGYQEARAAIEDSLSPALMAGMQVESLTFPHPPEFVETERTTFAVVPTLMVLQLDGQQVESLNFQFGVLDADSMHWKYVEGSRLNSENVRVLFPSFPNDYDFPEVYRRKL